MRFRTTNPICTVVANHACGSGRSKALYCAIIFAILGLLQTQSTWATVEADIQDIVAAVKADDLQTAWKLADALVKSHPGAEKVFILREVIKEKMDDRKGKGRYWHEPDGSGDLSITISLRKQHAFIYVNDTLVGEDRVATAEQGGDDTRKGRFKVVKDGYFVDEEEDSETNHHWFATLSSGVDIAMSANLNRLPTHTTMYDIRMREDMGNRIRPLVVVGTIVTIED
jgi:hypothetical protein